MTYFELRHQLADKYLDKNEIERFGRDSGLDITLVDLNGSPLLSWNALLEAARKQKKVADLFDCISAENTDNSELLSLMPEAKQELQSAGETFTSRVDLTEIQIYESERMKLSHSLVNVLERLPKPLVDFALLTSHPQSDEIDYALKEAQKDKRTREAKAVELDVRNKSEKQQAALINEQERLSSEANGKRHQIARIRSIPEPSQPFRPPEPSTLIYGEDGRRSLMEDHERDLARYEKAMAAYQTDLARYKEDRAQLPALESELKKLEREVERAANEIRKCEIDLIPQLAELRDRIRDARNHDMTECVADLLEKSVKNLRDETALLPNARTDSELEGFARFLLAAVLDEKFQNIPEASNQELRNAFTSRRDEIETILESKHQNIVRPLFAAVSSTLSTMTCNKELYDKIGAKLNRVSEDELNRKLKPLNQMMHVHLPTIPEYQNLIDPVVISQVLRHSLNELERLAADKSSIECELGEGGRNFAERVAAARADADQVLWELCKNADGALRIAHGMETILNLASRSESILGPRTLGFCDSLRIEAERRAGCRLEELWKRSVPRSFWQADAQELIDSHRSAEYVGLRSSLQTKLGEVKTCDKKLNAALEGMRKQPRLIRDKYLLRFQWYVWLTLIPLVNLIFSFFQWHNVLKLQKALESTEEAYIDLGTRGRRSIFMRLLVSALLMLVYVSVAIWGKVFPIDRNWRLVFGIVSLIYLLNTFWVALILGRWNSFTRSKNQLAH